MCLHLEYKNITDLKKRSTSVFSPAPASYLWLTRFVQLHLKQHVCTDPSTRFLHLEFVDEDIAPKLVHRGLKQKTERQNTTCTCSEFFPVSFFFPINSDTKNIGVRYEFLRNADTSQSMKPKPLLSLKDRMVPRYLLQ